MYLPLYNSKILVFSFITRKPLGGQDALSGRLALLAGFDSATSWVERVTSELAYAAEFPKTVPAHTKLKSA